MLSFVANAFPYWLIKSTSYANQETFTDQNIFYYWSVIVIFLILCVQQVATMRKET